MQQMKRTGIAVAWILWLIPLVVEAFCSRSACSGASTRRFSIPKHKSDRGVSFSRLYQVVSSVNAYNNTDNNNNNNGAERGVKLPQSLQHPHVMLVGKSPKVIRLRKTLQAILDSDSNNPIVVIYGPKGSGKTDIAEELVEGFSTREKHHHDGKVITIALDDAASFLELLSGTDEQEGLLDRLSNDAAISSSTSGAEDNALGATATTLVLRGFEGPSASDEQDFERRQQVEAVVVQLLTKRSFQSHKRGGIEVPFAPRIIYMVNDPKEPEIVKLLKENNNHDDVHVHLVKVPSLAARTDDMLAIANAKLKAFENEFGLSNVMLTPEANKRLLDHAWNDGEPELDQELRKSLLRLALDSKKEKQKPNALYFEDGSRPFLLRSEHMLTDVPNESIRTRLLYKFPALRNIVQSPWIFDHTLRYIVTPVYIAFLAVLFLGAQTRDQSAALTIFWAGWWPLVMLSFPFLGRIWCAICPFMAVGNWAQDTVQALGVKLKKWPKWVEDIGAPFAFGLFFAILVWEELWDLPQNGTLSAWLLLLITSGAVFNSVQYEKRLWCRYLCPIGAMCRTFASVSMTEVRSFKANCQGCTDAQCVHGNSPVPDPSDEFAIKGCTMGLKNNQLQDMGHCTMCMSCVKNCEREVPELNTRPLGIDFGLPWLLPRAFQDPQNMAVSQVETNYWMGALLTVLQGSVLVHYLPRILYDVGMDPSLAKASPALDSPFFIHSALAISLLALPGLLSLLVDEIASPLENLLVRLRSSWGQPTFEEMEQGKVVIESYEAILGLDQSLEETLKELDPDSDGTISCWEFKRALRDVNLPESDCEVISELMQRRTGGTGKESLPVTDFLDFFQQLYLEARMVDEKVEYLPERVELKTKKTSVELFNELDQDGDGFIMPGDFDKLIDRTFEINRSWEEKLALFEGADVLGQGRLNLFEFMTLFRKTAKAGIQEIGYGYLPLAWASLTAYWAGIGLRELGQTIARVPSTFYLGSDFLPLELPSVTASDGLVKTMQTILILGSIPVSIGLTQKLCHDNKIAGLRFGVHVAVQVLGAWVTLYLMLADNPLAQQPLLSV